MKGKINAILILNVKILTGVSQLRDPHVLHLLEVVQHMGVVPGCVPSVPGPAVIVVSGASHSSHGVDAAGPAQDFTPRPGGALTARWFNIQQLLSSDHNQEIKMG